MSILWGIGGMLVILGIAYLLSSNKKAINWRTVLGALAIQVSFALIVLKWETGKKALQAVSTGVSNVVSYANEGITFLFGSMIPEEGKGFIFAFQVLTVIIFFSSLISVLYYLGIMQWVVRILGGALSKFLGTSKAESMSATANIFLGQTEAPLVIRPYMSRLTKSELFAVMVGGLASVAGSVLVGYYLLGVPLNYLIAASFMCAPAGLVMAKLMMPETEEPETMGEIKLERDEDTVNVIDAAARGASDGLQIALNVGAMLLAFIALIGLLNGILGGIGGWFGADITLQSILGYVFAPIAFVIGVPWDEAIKAGTFIGQKFVLNEFVAYSEFAPKIPELKDKTVAIVSFALCGFANLSSIAMLIGGLGSMAPSRRQDIAKLGMKAVIAATLANLLSGAVAGMFIL
ncbi:NupC/NupG family nucleoside CNT transporter [Fictibacillus aquaticus]|uniref:Nucleoside permease n=1 Tax=Fictibacillus aquaticus TaxID=2021314 RepID=A0A235F462_9BACL|nr:NupC/NupG family nucleoside CNT transporter [Fictibacillus aquaticus]OYD56032.1 NupC/NupG family nucleoside CNT transporter [Fictibacillus aquaticus]